MVNLPSLTSRPQAKEKPEEWLEDYFVQLSAYWAMFSERTGVVPPKVSCLPGRRGRHVQIVERKNIMKYLMTLQQYVNQFIEHKDAGTNELNKALNEKFVSKEKFASDIEALVLKTKMNYIDAIVLYCEDNGIEIESVGKLISKPLKDKVKFDATELNYLKRTTKGKLPL
jgi:hypothetical protein